MLKRFFLSFVFLTFIALTFSACTRISDTPAPTGSPEPTPLTEQSPASESAGDSGTTITSEQSTTTRLSDLTGETTSTSSAKTTIELVAQNPAPGENALTVLQKSGIKFETKTYGPAGVFITSLNDLAGNTNNYWAFYLNDEYAQEGVDKTIVKNGDKIKFVYERISDNK